jgi:alpha-D-ribose 1-methylphosphonate 5-triphosphate synthase subunit PhnH
MSTPAYHAAEAASNDTFQALMWALSYPGREQTLPDHTPAFDLIAATLLDLETTYFAPNAALAAQLARSGARPKAVSDAAYHFYPAIDTAALDLIRAASVGTLTYPDSAATLILGCTLGTGQALQFTGPGVRATITVHVGGLPDRFWALRREASRYPLGWDIFLVDGQRVMGVPRSTVVDWS